MRFCTVTNCNSVHLAKGYCRKHYYRMKYSGTLEAREQRPGRICEVEGCYRSHSAKGYCYKHYRRMYNNGTLETKHVAGGSLEKAKARWARRRASKSGAKGSWTYEEWLDLLDAYGHTCAYCGVKDSKLTQDHVVPLSRGGSNYIENILPACFPCNRSKRDKLVVEWRPELLVLFEND